MILRLLFFSLIFPLGLCAQCTFNLQAQGNVQLGSNDLICNGLLTQIHVNNIGSVGPYICVLQDSTSNQLLQQDTVTAIFHNFTPIGAGTYSITVIDSLGGSCTDYITITQPDSLYAIVNIQKESYCLQNGAIFAYPQGGVYPYTMTLSGVISPPFENLAGGWYSLQLSDANGCSFDLDSLLLPTVSDLIASIDTNSMTVSFTGGVSPIGVVWPNGETGSTLQEVMCPGDYEVLVDDASFCPPVVLNFSIADIEVVLDISAAGVTNVSGGTPPYNYIWSTGDTAAIVEGLCAGEYVVEVLDAGACSVTQSFVIDSLQAILDEQEAMIFNLGGGTPPYSYAWYTDGVLLGEFGTDIDGLCHGYHEVVVTDAQGCNAVYGWEIMPLESGLLWDDVDCTQQDFDGEARVIASGGTAPYTVSWNGGGAELLDIAPGVQRVMVTDYQGCVLRDSIFFAELKAECVYNVISTTVLDGVNDEWGIEPAFLYADSRVSVFNRWGKRVFTSEGYAEPFAGKDAKGRLLQAGVYFYAIQLRDGVEPLRGSLTIY